MVLETHMNLCMTAGFSRKFFLRPKLGKWTKNGPQTGFLESIENHYSINPLFLLNLFYNENLYYLLRAYTNPIFWKIFVLEIWTKMCTANQIVGFFNQPYLQNKSMK